MFFTPRITLDIFAVGVQHEGVDQRGHELRWRWLDGRERSRASSLDDNDSNAAAGGIVGEVA